MKTKSVSLLLASALSALALISFNHSAFAGGSDDPAGHDAGDDQGGLGGGSDDPAGHDAGDDRSGHHRGETNEIEGREIFHGHIVLVTTANASTKVKGSAELEQENEEGTVFYKVQVRESGLPAGTYSVTATLVSDRSIVTLGDLTAEGVRVARADLLLPAGVSIMDLGSIIVSDSEGNDVLAGDVNAAALGTMASFNANVRITPGTGAPNAKGRAHLSITQRHGQQRERFTLMASRMSPNTTFKIEADGTQVGTVVSNRRGTVVIRSLGTNLETLQDLRLISDSDATEALSVHF